MRDSKNQNVLQDTGCQARQQARLWMNAGDRACLRRQFIRGLRYYQQALEVAERHHLHDLQARLCRDLAYVYVHHGAAERALQVLDPVLNLEGHEPETHLGLLFNRAVALLTLHDYRTSLATVRTAISYFDQHYPRLPGAFRPLPTTYNALHKMARDLERVVDLLDDGVNPDRIEVSVRLARPYWLPSQDS